MQFAKIFTVNTLGGFFMALINCPECGKEISDTIKACPHCGYNLQNKIKPKIKNTLKTIIIILIVLVLTIVSLLLMGKGSIKVAFNIIRFGSFECIKEHDLGEATCQHGQICSRCNSEIGQTVDHKWMEATCQHGNICIYCNIEEGEKTDHQWENATCTQKKTCTICGLTEGEILGHTTRQGYCQNCNNYINELQGIYDYILTCVNDSWDLIDESMNTMNLTESFYDTTYVASANELDYKLQNLLYETADTACQYEEFYDIGYELRMAGAKLYLFDSLTSDTGFGSYTYMTGMLNSIADCTISLGNAQKLINELAE